MAWKDDGFGRKAIEERANGRDERVPVAEGQVGPADAARKEDIAGKESPVGRVGDMPRRVAG